MSVDTCTFELRQAGRQAENHSKEVDPFTGPTFIIAEQLKLT
jgi:hypothetical protein